MNKALIIASLLFVGCATAQPPVRADLKEDKHYTFNFNRWQSFFYTDDAKTMVLMLQVKDMTKQQIPMEFQIKSKDETVQVLKLGAAFPEIKKGN